MSAILGTASIVGSYFLGGLMPGYWLVRWRTGRDVRAQGSGGAGATNAGRALGRSAFFAVMLFDIGKGALAVALARRLALGEEWIAAVALALVVGHVWPALLGFRGGRGMAPLAGVWLALAPSALALCFVPAAVVLAFDRRVVIAGLAGLCTLPATVWWATEGSRAAVICAAGCALVVLFAHRSHLRRRPRLDTAPS